jgi:hypothetical protein
MTCENSKQIPERLIVRRRNIAHKIWNENETTRKPWTLVLSTMPMPKNLEEKEYDTSSCTARIRVPQRPILVSNMG